MKKFKIVIFVLAIGVVLVIVQINFGLFNRFNFVTAHWDEWRGNERIIIYGEPFATDSLKSALAPKFGFKYERQENCTVSKSFVNGVNDYNRIMGQKIKERLGSDWDDMLAREISKIN